MLYVNFVSGASGHPIATENFFLKGGEMKSIRNMLLSIGVIILLNNYSILAQSNIGEQAPDFTLSDKDGNTYSLSDFAGKVILINFIGHS